MNSNHFQQWWQNTTYHPYLAQQQQQQLHQPANIDSSLFYQNTTNEHNREVAQNYAALQHSIEDANSNPVRVFDYDTLGNLSHLTSYDGFYSDEYSIYSLAVILMGILYGLVIFGGVLGNTTLLITLCSASSVKLRNPLLLSVCLADLLVTGFTAPVTLFNLATIQETKTVSIEMCKTIEFIQAVPVAASTLSFFLLSLDRYATVKHPCLAQLRQRRYLHFSLAVCSWLVAAIVSIPFLFLYKMVTKTVELSPSAVMPLTTTPLPTAGVISNVSISCTTELETNSTVVVLIHTFIVFILPGLGVLLNHYGVRRKLCALSLTARAAHGELPLPMPILRRQTHMVIVTGIANAHQAGCGGPTDDTSNGGADIQMQNLNPSSALNERSLFSSKNPISPRAMREIREHSQRQRLARAVKRGRRVATPGIPLPQTSSLRSRRHLANILMGSAFLFIFCWTSHVFCIIDRVMGYRKYCQKSTRYFSLLLGCLYSAFSPIIYWALNHNSLRQSPCAPIIRLRSIQKFLRTRFRSNPVPPAPSSTNEAQLGAFNPKLIKLTPKQYRAQASSHYLY